MLNSAPFCIVESKTEVFEICLFAPRMHWICTSEISRLCSAVGFTQSLLPGLLRETFYERYGAEEAKQVNPIYGKPVSLNI